MSRRERPGSKKARLIAGDYQTSDTENYEGMPAWTYTPKERLIMTLLTNTLEPTFYAPAKKLATEALENHNLVLDDDPDFYMKALAYGRQEGYMRLQPILGLVLLTAKELYIPPALFNKVILTPNDLASFIDLCKNAGIRQGMGQKVKTLIKQWLAKKLSEYWYIKYKEKVVQGIKLSHPKMTSEWDRPIAWRQAQRQVIRKRVPDGEDVEVETEAQAESLGTVKDLVDYAMIMEDDARDVDDTLLEKLPKVKVYHELKSKVYSQEEITIGEVRRAIHEARLPHEAVTGIVRPTKEIWKEVMFEMPYFALLRHLVTLHRSDVFSDTEALMGTCDKISNGELVRKSKILPFRFYKAYKMIKQERCPTPLIDALELALEASFANIPTMDGTGCIAIDVSGSMTSYPTSDSQRPSRYGSQQRGDLMFIEIAGTFGVPLMMKSPDAHTIPFDMAGGYGGSTRGIYPNLIDRRTSMLDNIDKLCRHSGGGTDCSLPVRYLIEEDIQVDWFVGITDNEEWGAFSRVGDGEGWITSWKRYRENIAPEAKAFVITISPYGHSMYPFNEPGIFQIFGWSDQVLKFIQLGLAGISTQLTYVQNFPLEVEIVERE